MQSRKKSSAPLLHLGVVAIEKGAFVVAIDYGYQLYLFVFNCLAIGTLFFWLKKPLETMGEFINSCANPFKWAFK